MRLVTEPSLGLLALLAQRTAHHELTVAIQTAPTDLWWGHHLSHIDVRWLRYVVN